MNKAEDKAAKKALEKFPILFSERMGYDKTNLQQERRNAYEKGYQQAEKDLELTWKDMTEIVKIANLLEIEWLNSTPWDGIRDWGFYQEVLKRFNKIKELRNEL